MQDFKRLAVWHKAHACFLAFYRVFGTGKTDNSFGHRTQLLKAVASIAANIAEGAGKTSTKEFLRFLDVAIGSARGAENHLIVARDIGIIRRDQFHSLNDQLVEVQRMLIGLINTLKKQPPRPNA